MKFLGSKHEAPKLSVLYDDSQAAAQVIPTNWSPDTGTSIYSPNRPQTRYSIPGYELDLVKHKASRVQEAEAETDVVPPESDLESGLQSEEMPQPATAIKPYDQAYELHELQRRFFDWQIDEANQ